MQSALAELLGETLPDKEDIISSFSFVSDSEIEFFYDNRPIHYNLETETAGFVSPLATEGEDPLAIKVVKESFPQVWSDQKERLSPDRRFVLSFDEENLFLRGADGEITTIAPNGPENVDWMLNDSYWSPDSRYVLVTQLDTTATDKTPVVDWKDWTQPIDYLPYPSVVGELMHFQSLFYDVETGETQTFDFPAEHYIKPVQWLPDGSAFVFAALSRDALTIQILLWSPETGEMKTALKEESETYIIYPPNLMFRLNGYAQAAFSFLEDSEHFLWISERSGFRQIYLYHIEQGLIRALTDHPFDVMTVDGFNKQTGQVIYTAQSNPERVHDIHVHTVNWKGGDSKRLSTADGQHEVKVSPSGQFYIDKYSTTDHPPIVELRSVGGELVKTLSVGKRPIGADLIAPTPEHFSALAADGKTTIHGVIFKPSDFDPNKKYPVFDGIYGGGFVKNVPYKFDSPHPFFGRNMAELGFVIVAVDARGTPARGREFKDMARKQFGQFEIADHMAAIKSAAKDRPWMDTDRVGIVGHSYGGHFATRALLQAPDFFKVGVASGIPQLDEGGSSIASEAFTGILKPGDPKFAEIDNNAIADQLKGDLLIVIQTSDVNTPMHGPVKLIDALTSANKPYDAIILPGANHAFNGSNHRRYFYERVGAYFQEHLGGPE
ncbi:MAG: DPP IV N-terminal domain-containing protein [Pseudomonadota bacterium]